MAQTVIGFFDDQQDAQRAVERLQSAGIGRDRVDVSSGNTGTGGVGYNRSGDTSSDSDREGGVSGFFKGLFGDDDENADRYSRVASSSNSIVTVHAQTSDEAEQAADILDDCGAIDVDERAASVGYTSRSTGEVGERTNLTAEGDTTIQRIEENLEVGKRQVERGGVRVRSRIVERPVEETVRLRQERVHVERQPVDRPVTAADENLFREGEIELTERSEVPVVNKQARVVEEVKISKEVNEREETIRDTVRNTEIDIENIEGDRTRHTDTDRTGSL
jgi:uncharacterized protein (TIGR02271 family)